MPHGIHGLSRHACQRERTAHLLAQSGQDFHFAARVLVRGPVLDVDDAYHPVAGNHRGGKECFKTIFRKFAEVLESGVFVRLTRNSQQSPFPCNPARETLVQLQAHFADFGLVVRVGGAED